jgi:hypothetical protein
MKLKLYIILSLIFIAFNGNAQSTIKGKIVDKKGEPVPFATIYLKKAATGSSSDENGFFNFSTKFEGKDSLVVSSIGFEDYTNIVLLENKEISFTITLREPQKILEEVIITAGTIEANNDRSVAVLKPLDIVTTAGAQGDIIGAIQTLPGVQRNGGDQTGLMVRGGDVNESTMIIDGMIAQNAFNSSVPGVSQRSRFNPFQFKGTSFSSGGYTARYGQALSGVLDLQTNDLPEKSTINIGANMAGLYVSGAKLMNKNSIEFSGNYTNLAPFYKLVPTNVDFYTVPQGGSFSTRFVSKTDDNNGIFKMNFSNSFNKSGIQISNPAVAGDKINFNLENENTYFNTSFRYFIKPTLKYFSAFSFSNNIDNIGFGNVPLYKTDNRVQGRVELWNEFSRKFNVLVGSDIQRITYSQKFDTLIGKFDELLSAGYVEAEYKPYRRFAVKPGFRGEYSKLIARGNIVPRLAFAYKISNSSQVSFAGGMFYQTASTQYLLQGYRPGFQQSIHYMLNYQVMGNNRTLRVEGYYKSYDQLVREKGVAYTPNQFRFNYGELDNSGSGYAQGIDFFFRDKKTIKNLDYWISYSYIDTKRLYQNYISKVTPDYVSQHNLNIVAKYFVEKIQTNFSATYSYSSGRSFYNPNSTSFLADHAPAYQNFAMTVSYLTTIKGLFAVFYLSADNILNTKNILGYRYSMDGLQRYAITPPLYRSIFVGFNLSLSKFNKDEL